MANAVLGAALETQLPEKVQIDLDAVLSELQRQAAEAIEVGHMSALTAAEEQRRCAVRKAQEDLVQRFKMLIDVYLYSAEGREKKKLQALKKEVLDPSFINSSSYI